MSTPDRFREHLDPGERAQVAADERALALAETDPGDTWAELMASAERRQVGA